MNLTCQYPQRPQQQQEQAKQQQQPPLIDFLVADDLWLDQIDPALFDLDFPPIHTSYGSASSLYSTPSPGCGGSPRAVSPSLPSAILRSHVVQTMAPAEYDLFKHYLEHTSKDLTVDEEDQYTLQVGIPDLACICKPLMRSVLALAAICKCWDIINQAATPLELRRMQVKSLVSQAQKYHMESIREIQVTIRDADCYDTVLANAAMMGMYGSGNYWTRIWLVKTRSPDSKDDERDIMPKHAQWISLYRAVDLAYGGLLNGNTPRPIDCVTPAWSPSGFQLQYGYRISPDTCPNITDHVLSPILAVTLGSAMAKLNEKANTIATTYPMDQELKGCLSALSLLSAVVTEAFPPAPLSTDDTSSSMPSTPGTLVFEVVDIDPGVGKLSKISPWIRRYTASITSMIPSRLPRRMIMSFAHKISCGYLDLVRSTIWLDWFDSSDETDNAEIPEPSMASQLAVDIFAHWLVLTILLDNVWWIGGIGAWELGRIVKFRENALRQGKKWGSCLWNEEEDWWPESMYEVSRQLDKHKTEVQGYGSLG